MSRTSHVLPERLRNYAATNAPLIEEEHAHITRCVACQQLLGQYLAASTIEDGNDESSS